MASLGRRAVAARRVAFSSAVLFAAPVLPAQVPLPVADGFRAEPLVAERGTPWRTLGLAPGDAPGEVFFAIGNTLWRASPGSAPAAVAITPSGGDIGLVARPGARGELLYTDFALSSLIAHDVATGGETRRAIPSNTFDVERRADGVILLAANPDWPMPLAAAGVFALPAAGGAAREIVRLAGPSGPIQLDAATGDLFCAWFTAGVPAPPSSVSIVRFARARLELAIAGGARLGLPDAVPFASGLDGAFDLAQDDRGALWVSDPVHGDVRRIARDGAIDPAPLVPRSSRAALALAFLDGGPAKFAPWQPGDGAALLVATSDFTTESNVHAVTAAPPRTTSPQAPNVAPGAMRIDLRGLPPNAHGVLLVSVLPPVPARIVAWSDDLPLVSDLDFLIPPIDVAVVADARGDAHVDLVHPGGFLLPLSFAAAGVAPNGAVAISPSLQLVLLP